MSASAPTFSDSPFAAYPAMAFRAVYGAQEGDALYAIEPPCPGDIYRLQTSGGARAVSPTARPSACLSFISSRGEPIEIIVLSELRPSGPAAMLVPTGPLRMGEDYTFIGPSREDPARVFARMACVSFLADTRLTRATGEQVTASDLLAGDRLLTRDAGAQPVRWLQRETIRLEGAFAPIRFDGGVLNNDKELTVLPQHRMYLSLDRVSPAAELLDRHGATRLSGGNFDVVHLLFDARHVVYAEAMPVEGGPLDEEALLALKAPPRSAGMPLGGTGTMVDRLRLGAAG